MCNILDHRKIKMIRKCPEGNTLVLLWLLMLAEAGKCNRGGYLMVSDSLPYSAETLSMVTDINLPTVQLGLTTFAGLDMIDHQDGVIFILNWGRYQSEEKLEVRRERDRERKQRQRQKEREKILALPVMSRDSHGGMSRDVTLENREEKNREEQTTAESIRALLSGTPLYEISGQDLECLINRHGHHHLLKFADVSAETWRRNRKVIQNPGGYLQVICDEKRLPSWYEPQDVRKAKQSLTAERKRSDIRAEEEMIATEMSEARAKEEFWLAIPEDEREKIRLSITEFSLLEITQPEIVETIAKSKAWKNRTQMAMNA